MHEDIQRTDPRLLAKFMSSPEDRDIWGLEDLAAMVRHQLAAPLVSDLESAFPGCGARVAALAASVEPAVVSFGDLLTHLSPPLKLLQLVKDLAESAREGGQALPEEVASYFYFASIAAALQRAGAQISSLSEEQLHEGLTWLLQQAWIEGQPREILEALQQAPRTEPAQNLRPPQAPEPLPEVSHDRDVRRLLAGNGPEEIRGVLLGDFVVGRPVGEGGFGTVHVGRQLSTGRKVAIKLLHDGMTVETKMRFRREAGYLARFNHRNIVGVLGHGEDRWSISPLMDLSQESWFQAFARSAPVKTFIAMEWVDGRTLETIYQQARKDPANGPSILMLVDWFAQSAGALCAVHATGLVHRDVKPGNLMVTESGVVKLMDFGIARLQDQSHTLVTTAGRVFGTIMYMSPEQIRAAEAETSVGPSTDIYSLCGTFYELFTGTRLYEHEAQSADTVKTLKLAGQRPQAPRKYIRELPWEIEVILLGGLEAEIADRYRSMESLERDLQHFLKDEAIEYRRPSLPRRLQLGYRRHRALAHVVAGVLVAASVATGFYLHSLQAEQARTLAQRELAQRNARESLARLAASYEEQGRQRLLAGEPLRAVVYLSQAYSMGRDVPPMRYLLAQATRAIPARIMPSQGHTRGVYTAEFNADASEIVTAGRDGLVKIWDTATGRVLQTLQLDPAYEVSGAMFNRAGTRVVAVDDGGHGAVWDVASGRELFRLHDLQSANYTPRFSPDGSRILTAGSMTGDGGSPRGAACVFDATDGHRLLVLPHDAPVICAFYDAAGTQIVTGSEDRCAILWDALTGRKLHVLAATDKITRAVFSPDGSKVAVTSESPFTPIKIYDAETGRNLQGLNGHHDIVRRCIFSPPDGKMLITCSRDATARLWDWQAGTSVVLQHQGQVFSAAFSHDGQLVGTASRDGTVKLWDTASGGFAGQLVGHGSYVYQLVFSSDDRTILTASEDKTARLWDARSHLLLRIFDGRPADEAPKDSLLRVIQEGNYVTGVSLSPDGTQILDNSDAPTIRNTATGEEILTLAFLVGKTKEARFSPDGRYVAAVDSNRGVGIVNLATRDALSARLPGDLDCLAFSPDGQRLIVGGTSDAWILDARNLKILATLPHSPGQGEVDHAEFSPDGHMAVTAGSDGTARLWDPATGALKATFPHAASVTWATFSPDGRWVLTASRDATAVLWDAMHGSKTHTLRGHTDYVTMAVFSRDGRQVVTASRDYTAKVWDSGTGKQLASLEGHVGLLTCANFSPDASLVVTAGQDGTARVWDAATGRLLTILRGHLSDVRWAEFSRDGTRIVTASEDHTVRIWDAPLESRPAEQIADLVKHAAPWRLDGERLVAADLTSAPATQPETQAARPDP